jgi:hypothetical protein
LEFEERHGAVLVTDNWKEKRKVTLATPISLASEHDANASSLRRWRVGQRPFLLNLKTPRTVQIAATPLVALMRTTSEKRTKPSAEAP